MVERKTLDPSNSMKSSALRIFPTGFGGRQCRNSEQRFQRFSDRGKFPRRVAVYMLSEIYLVNGGVVFSVLSSDNSMVASR